jgi:hypothetical protein
MFLQMSLYVSQGSTVRLYYLEQVSNLIRQQEPLVMQKMQNSFETIETL